MGNNASSFSEDMSHFLSVKGHSSKDKKTPIKICVVLLGNNKIKSTPLELECGHKYATIATDFLRGSSSEVVEIELWRNDPGSDCDWFCDVITLFNIDTGNGVPFPVQRWIRGNKCYRVRAYDTCLPQDDPYPDQRTRALEDKKKVYLTNPLLPYLTGQESVLSKKERVLPKEEEFPDYRNAESSKGEETDIATYLKTNASLVSVRWNKFDDVQKLYQCDDVLPVPQGYTFWQDDEWFAAMRLVGANPTSLRLCTEIPSKFPVTDELLKPILGENDLNSLVSDKRLFIVDLDAMEGLTTGKHLEMVAPVALFFLDDNKTLMPLAIQLNQEPGSDNPIFTPVDDKNLWTLAKMWFGVADMNYQEILVHMGWSHLVMESIAVTTHRNLAPNHPVFRMLAPHFFSTMAIVNEGLHKLVSDDGLLDTCNAINRKGAVELMRKKWSDFKLGIQGAPPVDQENRGINDPEVLPMHPYRDDGMLHYDAIKSYVQDVLEVYYDESGDQLKNDEEIHRWIKQLSAPTSQHGGSVQGIPEEINTLEELVDLCANIIFNCTARHAAIHFSQDAYPLNMPLRLIGTPPKNKKPLTQAEIMQYLPDKALVLRGLIALRETRIKSYKPLAYWDKPHQFDPKVFRAEQKFRQELDRISKEIEARNSKRSKYYQYTYMIPKRVPNSILT